MQTAAKRILNKMMNKHEKIKIIPFEAAHAEAVSCIITRNLLEVNTKDYPQKEMQALAEKFRPEDVLAFSRWRRMFCAVEGEKVLGTAGYAKIPPENNQGEYYMLSVFVLPEQHGRGIGKMLVQAVERAAAGEGAQILTVPASRTALQFYIKAGYCYKNNCRQENEDGLFILEKFF